MDKTLPATIDGAFLASTADSGFGRILELPGPFGLPGPPAAETKAADFVLVLNRGAPLTICHERPIPVPTGDAVLLDANKPHRVELVSPFNVARMLAHAGWLNRCVPNAVGQSGRVISRGSQWGCPIVLFMEQLAIGDGPWSGLPLAAVLDQFGVLLALHSEAEWGERYVESDADAIRRSIADRCFEPSLDVHTISQSLLMSDRTLHRVLRRDGTSFSRALAEARVEVARRMLESPIFNRLTTAEIGTRSGFRDPSHFARSFRRAFGVSPAQARRGGSSA